jgi:hypothetical protein
LSPPPTHCRMRRRGTDAFVRLCGNRLGFWRCMVARQSGSHYEQHAKEDSQGDPGRRIGDPGGWRVPQPRAECLYQAVGKSANLGLLAPAVWRLTISRETGLVDH